MIIDFIIYNSKGILLFTILLNVFVLNKKRYLCLLLIDIILNKIPFASTIIVLLSLFNKEIFKILKNTFINEYIILILYYFLFGIVLYSIYNTFNYHIINILMNNLLYNLIYFFFGLKYLKNKYNFKGEIYEK